MINLDRLQTWLNQGGLQKQNPPIYQFLSQLALAVRELQTTTVGSPGTPIPPSGIANQQFLTWNNNLPTLPNSRQLIAGDNVTFDDTVFGERTVNVSASIIDHVVLSDGVPAGPQPINDGAGNFIYIPYTP